MMFSARCGAGKPAFCKSSSTFLERFFSQICASFHRQYPMNVVLLERLMVCRKEYYEFLIVGEDVGQAE